MTGSYKIAVLPGDGIGPEIMDGALHVLEVLGAGLACGAGSAWGCGRPPCGAISCRSALASARFQRRVSTCAGAGS